MSETSARLPARIRVPQGETGWPRMLGIVAITLAILGGVSCGFDALSLLLNQFMLDVFDARSTTDDVQRAIAEYFVPQLASALVGMALAAYLLVLGIGLLKRRPWSRQGLLLWSGLKVVHALVAATLNYMAIAWMKMVFEKVATVGSVNEEVMEKFVALAGALGAVVTLVTMLALPLVLLVWLNRRVVVEEVQTWESAPASGAKRG